MTKTTRLKPTAPPSYDRVHARTRELDRAVSFAMRLVRSAEALTAALDLELPDLPPTTGSPADQASLHTAAPLYFASELESARLLPAVETFTGLYASGAIPVPLGPAEAAVARFWKGRHERLASSERQAFYAHLFGGDAGPTLADPSRSGVNTSFESLMIDLAQAIYQLNPLLDSTSWSGGDAAIRQAAMALASNLSSRAGGFATFAAKDLLGTIQQAVEILKQPQVQRAVGASSLWMTVESIVRLYLHEEVDVTSHVTRGRSGMMILAWVGDVSSQLEGTSGTLVSPQSPLIGAAAAWLQASLTLHEAEQPRQQPNTPAPAGPGF
jgi:hypothetical protein